MRRRFMSKSKVIFDYSNYMTIEALEDGVSVKLSNFTAVMYGINGVGWENYRKHITINRGDLLSLKYVLPEKESFPRLEISGNCNLKGNCLSLVFGDNPKNDLSHYPYCFNSLFSGCYGIRNIESSFLPATTLASNCYHSMFKGCSSLTTAPVLPATRLVYMCYYSMFDSCISLTSAPELPAPTLESYCYRYMFNECSKLNYIKMLATDISASSCLTNWLSGVASTGTFVKNPAMTSLPTGNSGIPSGWTVVNDGEESGGGNDKDIQGDFPEESKSFGFPLYLNVTKFEEESEWEITYIRDADEISIKFYQWVSELNLDAGDKLVLNEDQSIVINGINIREISNEYGIYLTPTPNGINDLILESSGNLIGYKYK